MEVASAHRSRLIRAAEFFESTWQTAVADDQILVAVRFPIWSGRSGFAVEEVAWHRGDFAISGAACALTVDGEAISRAAIALFDVGLTPVRARRAEEEPVCSGSAAELATVGTLATADLEPSGDVHASAAYRKQVAGVVVRRAVARAFEDACS
jgi:carbon-monoxide dehydrogenase medium subunit